MRLPEMIAWAWLFLFLTGVPSEGAQGQGAGQGQGDRSLLTVERIISGDEFHEKGLSPARWLKNGSAYVTLEPAEDGHGRDLVEHEPATGRRTIVVAASKLKVAGASEPLAIDDYAWSDDARLILFFTNTRRVWRLNTRGDYWVFDRTAGTLRKIGNNAPEASLMFAKFSPDASRVAFVRDNNLYVQTLADDKVIPLTTDGSTTRINGTFDWVYEEELFLRDGYRWSPDGRAIAYWQLDTTGMGNYVLVNTTDTLYPRLTTIPYPKVGQTNPSNRVGIVSAAGGETTWMSVPGDRRDNYVARMDWANDSNELVIQQLNRLQNHDQVILADGKTGQTRTVLDERDEAWVEVVDDLQWINQGRQFTWISERDGWRHLYRVGREGDGLQLITVGAYDVVDVLRVDDPSNEVDFIASPDDPKSRYLYRGTLDGSNTARRLSPINQPGTHSYQIAPGGRWAIHTYSTFQRPPVVDLISLPDHKVVRTLVDNSSLAARLDNLKSGPTEFLRVAVEDGTELDAWCRKPPGFDPSKRYPLLIHVYGEPAGQTVLDRWGGRHDLWHRMLAQRGFVVVSIDNRGTPSPRGRAWRKSIYRQVGILASKDQAEAVRALEKRWAFINPKRVGVWGWSGGGSMSLNAIFRYPDLYQTAVAVAFVSDQTLYDSIYQERYMGLPRDNPDGYRDGSPITHAARLKGNLLMIHGTGDDNCHYQNCERLVDRLVAENKPFSMLAYPNRTHSISEGTNTSRHLYESMTRYLEQNLSPDSR